MVGETVTAWCASERAGDLRRTLARLEEPSDAARDVPRQDRRADSVAPAGGADRGLLSQTRARSPSVPAWTDAALAPRAVVLQPQRPRRGWPVLRSRVGRARRGTAALGRAARRDDEPELAPPVGVGRSRLPGCRQARGKPGRGGGRTGRDEGRQASPAGQSGSTGRRGEAHGVGPGEGRASLPVRESPLRLRAGVHPARIP